MPLLGTLFPAYISTPQPSFPNHLGTLRVQHLFHGSTFSKFASGKQKAWKVSVQVPRKVYFDVRDPDMRGALLIKAVATLEPKYLIQSEDGEKDYQNLQLGPEMNPQIFRSSGGDSSEMDEREKLRRMRISKANKGNVPWNKGRKHSEETLRRIRERTKLAMQDPKVKMKLINLGHAQSEETRIKIGVGVRMGWQRRRQKLMVQETCHFEWQNLIAEASRRGYVGEEELRWDSYKILNEQLEQEWLESIERRKSAPRPKGCKRAPKSPEQRRKISEAISAKWADPGYRERVCSALSKYHGTPIGAKRKPRRMPSGETQNVIRSPVKKKASEAYNSAGNQTKRTGRSRLKRSSAPSYKDPLANSKLEMIKNIRAQRASMETKKREATDRAKLLIVEAEKAAKALEAAAARSPLARASLMETRKLIAEATQSIKDIETGQVTSQESKSIYSFAESSGLVNHIEDEIDTENGPTSLDKREANGNHILLSGNINDEVFDFGMFSRQILLNSKEPHSPAPSSMKNLPDGGEPLPPSLGEETSSEQSLLNGEEALNLAPSGDRSSGLQPEKPIKQSDPTDHQVGQLELNGVIEYRRISQPNGEKVQIGKSKTASSTLATVTKKWVCGRLVEVDERE